MSPKKNKAQEQSGVRTLVNERGLDLLKLIASTGGMFLSEAEAGAEYTAGNIQLGEPNPNGDGTQMITLTPAGQAAVSSGWPSAAAAAPAVAPVEAKKYEFEIEDGLVIPEKKPRGGGKRGSKYPFDRLEIGQNFHVPVNGTLKTPKEVAGALASSITTARRRFAEAVLDDAGKPVMEAIKIKGYMHDVNGKRIKGSDGKWVPGPPKSVDRPKVIETRDFIVWAVGPGTSVPDDKKGPGARVGRTK